MAGEALYCSYCGAPVSPGKDTCPYCGCHCSTGRPVEYVTKVKTVREYPDGVPVKIASRVLISHYEMEYGGIRRAKEEIAKAIASQILRDNLCEFRTEDSPEFNSVIVYASVDILRK